MNYKKISTLFTLWIIQGLFALVWLLLIPTDAGAFSLSRILLISSLIAPIAFFVVMAYKMRGIDWGALSLHPRTYDWLYITGVILFVFPPIVVVTLLELGQSIGNIYTSYAERLAPLLVLLSLSGLEWCLWHVVIKDTKFSGARQILSTTLKIILLFVPVVAIVLITKLGISPTRDGSFGNPATPLLEWQILLAVMVGITAMLTEPYWKAKRLDVIVFALVYLSACLIWLADPLVPGFFATPPRAPNFEPYPFSDPLIYAQYSQSALVGNGFLWPDIPTRPFYVMLLTWLYAIAGQNYYNVIILQTILLAFFPAVLYLLGRELGSRPLGLSLALLAILRDLTANHAASFAHNYSYTKMFMSEIPTALFLVIFTILIIRWMKTPKPIWYFLLMGGVLGIASLIRLQSAALMAPLAVIAIFPLWKQRRREWFIGLTVTTLGLILTFSPWLIRNYVAADGFVVDNPISQSMTFARRWSGDNGNTNLPQLPNETMAQYVSRMNDVAIDSFKREPDRILSGAANHFFNNLITSLHTFPIRDRIESPFELFWPSHAFWQTDARSPLLSALYIILLAIGLAAAWIACRWIGLIPFVFSLAYHAWTALFLSSGDRFLIPIDWTWHLYLMLGLLILARLVFSGIHDFQWIPVYSETQPAIAANNFSWRNSVIMAGLILITGASLPLTELAFPEKYPELSREQLSTSMENTLLDGEVIVYGRAVYPRYYSSGEGEPDTAKLGYEVSEQSRLVFWLVGPNPGLVILPLKSTPEYFPHASNVWIVGTMDGDALLARIVKVEEKGKIEVYER